jgi:hypothetical protein
VSLDTVSFEGHPCVRFVGAGTTLFVPTDVGPRILGLIGRGENLLAVLPDAELERPGGRPYRLIGGHRLWAAPEVAEITYQPDDGPCEVTEIDGGIRVEAPPDGAELSKVIEIRPGPEGWVLDHLLRNDSGRPMTLAPWAVTQVRPGGEAILSTGPTGPGPRADRSLVVWPYTDLGEERLRFERDAVRIHAVGGASALKLGVAPSDGSVSYQSGDEVFEKRVEVDPGGAYVDRGAAVQVYVGANYCELETLGPLRLMEPGGTAAHRETWTLRDERV